MSSQILYKSNLSSDIDQVKNILVKKKLPFEVVELVYEYLSTTYLESIGASLEQLIMYSKNETYHSLKTQLEAINGGYEIKRDGEVITTNSDLFHERLLLVPLQTNFHEIYVCEIQS